MSAPALVYCCWCKNIVVPTPGVSGCVVLFLDDDIRHAYFNGAGVDIADGICEGCKNKLLSEEQTKKVVTHDLAQK